VTIPSAYRYNPTVRLEDLNSLVLLITNTSINSTTTDYSMSVRVSFTYFIFVTF